MGRLLLLEHVGFHLVYGGGHLHKLAQIDEPVRVEVGHPNGPQLAGLVSLFHGSIHKSSLSLCIQFFSPLKMLLNTRYTLKKPYCILG